MKLTKQKLITAVRKPLEAFGYTFFKTNDSEIIFCKKIQENLILTLGLTIHRFYNEQFTAEYYLSPTTHIYNTSFDIPIDSDERVGFLLTHEERKIYCDEPYIEPICKECGNGNKYPEGRDCWWNGLEQESVNNFLSAVKVTEPKFINDVNLIDRINNSKGVHKLLKEQEKIISYIGRVEERINYQFLPTKCLCAPMEWYKAAELVYLEDECFETKNAKSVVRTDGENAFRVYVLHNGLKTEFN